MSLTKHFYVYLTTNLPRRTVLYTGMTNSLLSREAQHKERLSRGSFTARYNAVNVVYYEIYTDVRNAIAREKEIKGWTRAKKNALIEKENPEWKEVDFE